MTVSSLENEQQASKKYNHQRLEKKRNILRFVLKYIGFSALAKINRVEGLENIPETGPVILMINHIAFIDSFIVLHLVPRNIVPLAKIEVYNYPIVGIFPRLWEVIPVRREEVDRRAIQQIFEVLAAGEIVLIAPEGTRGTALREGKEGVAYIASRSQVPVIPVAIQGTVGFPALRFTKAWKGAGATVTFGRPFHFRKDTKRPDRETLRLMTDEAMYILAAMLPPAQRGIYSDLSKATQKTITWLTDNEK